MDNITVINDNIQLTVSNQDTITLELSNVVPVTDKRIELPFNQSNLSIIGVLPVNHKFNSSTNVTIKNNTGELVFPDAITDNGLNDVLINLSSYTPIQGVWLAIIEG
jgi:hypothetical protein